MVGTAFALSAANLLPVQHIAATDMAQIDVFVKPLIYRHYRAGMTKISYEQISDFWVRCRQSSLFLE